MTACVWQAHACIGGKSVGDDIRKLENGVHIVSGTPGRVFDMIKRRSLRTRCVCVCVVVVPRKGAAPNPATGNQPGSSAARRCRPLMRACTPTHPSTPTPAAAPACPGLPAPQEHQDAGAG